MGRSMNDMKDRLSNRTCYRMETVVWWRVNFCAWEPMRGRVDVCVRVRVWVRAIDKINE